MAKRKMYQFYLYSEQQPHGMLISQCLDGSTAYALQNHYRNIYKDGDNLVTCMGPHKDDDERFCIYYDIFNLFLERHSKIADYWMTVPFSEKQKERS